MLSALARLLLLWLEMSVEVVCMQNMLVQVRLCIRDLFASLLPMTAD